MGVNLKFDVSNTFLCFHALGNVGEVKLHSPTCVSVVVCVARKPRPCLSYSGVWTDSRVWTIDGRGSAAFAGLMHSDFLRVGYRG